MSEIRFLPSTLEKLVEVLKERDFPEKYWAGEEPYYNLAINVLIDELNMAKAEIKRLREK